MGHRPSLHPATPTAIYDTEILKECPSGALMLWQKDEMPGPHGFLVSSREVGKDELPRRQIRLARANLCGFDLRITRGNADTHRIDESLSGRKRFRSSDRSCTGKSKSAPER